jgi:hypothetical protein
MTRYPHFDVQLQGGSLLSPVSLEFNEGVFGKIATTPIPTENAYVTTSPRFTGYAVSTVYQPLSQLYNIQLNIAALEVGNKLAVEQTRQQRQQVTNTEKDVYYSLLQTQSALDGCGDCAAKAGDDYGGCDNPGAVSAGRARRTAVAAALLCANWRPGCGNICNAAAGCRCCIRFLCWI